jgi:enoyl-CoA hydratase/carnithine racemase
MGRAKELIFTARRVPAPEALAMGLANRVSAPAQSLQEALALAAEIAQNAPVAVAAAKATIDEAWDLPMDDALARERAGYEQPLLSEDRMEGLQAFAEKRAPRWRGR